MNEGEKKVVSRMVEIYCRAHHQTESELCEECAEVRDYALQRLENCPYGEEKPTCGACSVHCYKSDMRLRIKEVMRFAGPRMLFLHPLATIRHFYKENLRKRNFRP